MIGMTVNDVARVTGGKLYGNGAAAVTGAVRDNREVEPGLMFCALEGARVDGHSFINDALQRGAPCALARRVPEDVTGPVIVVPSVETAMQTLAAHCREKVKAPVIGVTGSSGKTTTKEYIASVLGTRYNTVKTQGNLNNDLGVPLSVFRIGEQHEAAVIEIGISNFGEMTRLGGIVKPDIAVITLIGRSHLEDLHDRDGVVRAKAEIIAQVREGGLIILNGDDDKLAALRPDKRTLRYGMGESCDIRAEDYRCLGAEGSSFTLRAGNRSFAVKIPAYGRHMVYSALAAAAVGMELGLSDEEILEGIRSYQPVGRRARIERLGSLTLIDDCYNANPDSVAMAIASARDLPGRLVCILGDMLGLGDKTEALHREAGEIARASAAVLLTTGEAAKLMGGRWFSTRAELIAALPNVLKPGDNVLVKASHDMLFDEISRAVEELSVKIM